MRNIFVPVVLLLLGGCAAKPLRSDAAAVFLTSRQAPQECRYLGEVSGSQGNLLTADLTRDHDLLQGARNELRNNAQALGANYVVLENQTQSVNAQGPGGVYSASVFGNAYTCPDMASGGASQAGD